MKVTVSAAAGPFKVTAPNTNVTWQGTSTQTVTWDVANSDQAPVSCADVYILLSTDGGQNFTDTLAAGTPNNGSALVTVPNINSTTCRIMVKSVGNIFFDIDDANFSIEKIVPVNWLSFTAQKNSATSVLLNWSTANEQNNDHFDVERSSDGRNFSYLGSVKAGTNPNVQQNYSYTDEKTVNGNNYYRLKQVDNDGKYNYSATVQVTMTGALWIVYPNPATTKATIQIRQELKNASITLNDYSGKIVYSLKQSSLSAGQFINLPLANLAKGTYMLKIQSDAGNKTEKIEVQ